MSCANDFLRRIAGTVLALVVAVLACLTVPSVANAEPPPRQVQAHDYDARDYDQPTTYTATQRGQPVANVSNASSAGQRAPDRRLQGTLARRLVAGSYGYTTYDAHAALAHIDRTAGTTERLSKEISGDLSSLAGAQVAAKGGSELVQVARYPLAPKIQGQLGNRGWTTEAIDEAVQSGQQVRAVNKATGNPATRYMHPTTGQSLVIDDVTGR